MTILAVTSLYADGPMGKTSAQTIDEHARRERFVERAFGPAAGLPVSTGSVHGTNVVIVNVEHSGQIIPACDGLLTESPYLPLVVAHSDCVPVFLRSRNEKTVGMLHAGWRGVVAGIVPVALNKMISELRVSAADILVTFGPSLQSCHFEIQADVEAIFIERGFGDAIVRRDDKMFGDLSTILRRQCDESGISPENVTLDERCTYCSVDESGQPLFCSWRRDKLPEANMISGIMKNSRV